MDIIVTIPFVYFLLIRKKEIPKITVISVFVICLILAGYILPVENQSFLSQFKLIAIPFVELTILSFVLFKSKAIIKRFKESNDTDSDFFDIITLACKEIFPNRIGDLLATEISVVYYAFSFKKTEQNSSDYTYWKKSGIVMTVSADAVTPGC